MGKKTSHSTDPLLNFLLSIMFIAIVIATGFYSKYSRNYSRNYSEILRFMFITIIVIKNFLNIINKIKKKLK
jgi:hypothetical protein